MFQLFKYKCPRISIESVILAHCKKVAGPTDRSKELRSPCLLKQLEHRRADFLWVLLGLAILDALF